MFWWQIKGVVESEIAAGQCWRNVVVGKESSRVEAEGTGEQRPVEQFKPKKAHKLDIFSFDLLLIMCYKYHLPGMDWFYFALTYFSEFFVEFH